MKPPYPRSDHFDGERFFNPNVPRSSRSLLQVLRWRISGTERAVWPGDVADPKFPAPPAAVPPGCVAVTFINHASFLIRFAEVAVLTAPICSERCSPVSWFGPRRHRRPGLALQDLPRPDGVLPSLNRYELWD